MLNVGIDIGGTKIAGGVVGTDGTIVERLRVPTPTDTGALADAVADMVRELASRHDVHAVGVINPETGMPLQASDTSWTSIFADELVRVGAAVVVEPGEAEGLDRGRSGELEQLAGRPGQARIDGGGRRRRHRLAHPLTEPAIRPRTK